MFGGQHKGGKDVLGSLGGEHAVEPRLPELSGPVGDESEGGGESDVDLHVALRWPGMRGPEFRSAVTGVGHVGTIWDVGRLPAT